MIQNTPPEYVVVLFRNIPTNEAEILTNAQQGLRITRNVNGSQRASLRVIRDRVQQLQATVESCQREIVGLVTPLDYLE